MVLMNRLPILLLLLFAFGFQVSAAEPIDLTLLDGSRIKGQVMSVTASEVTVMTDFGVLRIDQAKLTPESKAKITEGSKPNVDALLRRVAELEGKVTQLQQENEALRRQVAGVAVAPASSPSSFTPSTGAPVASGLRFSRSSTGKRHNSGCRYYTSGTPCGPTDGIACKICGG